MERAPNGTNMGSYKPRVNVAKFVAENWGLFGDARQEKENKSEVENEGGAQKFHFKSQAFVRQVGGKSFRDLFTNDGGKVDGSSSSVVFKGKTVDVLDGTAAFMELFGKALVGRCVDLATLTKLNYLLSDAGVREVSLSYLGVSTCLLNSTMRKCVRNSLEITVYGKSGFTVLDVWTGQSLPFERVAWIKIYGVPVQLAEDSVYDSIAGNFGKVIHASNMTSDDIDLFVNCTVVLVGVGARINDQVDLKWEDKHYRVWLEEEAADWMPDCLEDGDSSEEGEPSVQFQMGDDSVIWKTTSRTRCQSLEEGMSVQLMGILV
ncbi:hypothetical protein HanHA300_Chr00c0805g0814241 [Helianthus annuus]|nr:hypothetical protein HanHA300_Chr00c0805g0814241 [Helianthus annuus]